MKKVLALYLFNKLHFSGGVCKSSKRLVGKTVIITGGNTGIGYETALDLAKRGARIILACRNWEKANEAAYKIKKLTDNDYIEAEYLDLADLSSVRHFAKEVNSKLDRLDILINNAGIMMCPYWKTKDGFEIQFGTNHLGHFLLTNELLDLLKRTENSRVITVSSRAHYGYFPTVRGFNMNWNDINWTKFYSRAGAYCQSKLCNILFTKELAKRLKGTSVTAVCLHPGIVRTDLILRHTREGPLFWIHYVIKFLNVFYIAFSKTPTEGAQTTIHCAVDEDIPKHNGYYFSDCKPKKPSLNARSDKDAEKLWFLSEKMVSLK